jgi:glycine hydroxymethyltransferase
MVILDKNLFLFPETVKQIAEVCRVKKYPSSFYDGAHGPGLILGDQFQNPFEEGAHYINGSIYKTFPGPQRGVILGNINMASEQEMVDQCRPRRNARFFQQSPSTHSSGNADSNPVNG